MKKFKVKLVSEDGHTNYVCGALSNSYEFFIEDKDRNTSLTPDRVKNVIDVMLRRGFDDQTLIIEEVNK